MKKGSPATPAAARGGGTTTRQKLLLIAFGLLLSVLALALLEGVLALLGLGDAARFEDPFVGFAPGRDLFEEKTLPDGGRVYATREEKLAFFNPQQFPVDKAPGTYRIFALGGSTTAGRPYDDQLAFCRWLGLYLEAMDPSRRWETINAGAISYASYRIAVLMQELARYEPDLFVVYTGHNEFLEERSYLGVVRQPPALRRLRLWLGGFRFYALARQGWLGWRDGGGERQPAAGALAGEVAAKLDGWTGLARYHRDDELRRSIVAHFAYNLDRIVALARAAGAEIVVVQPVSNLKDFSPFKSEHAPGLAPPQVARFSELLERGREQLAAGQPAPALAAFHEARALDAEHAELHFLIGRAELARGEVAAARAALVRAKDSDVAPLRALEEISELVRAAAARHGVPLVDLPALLEQRNVALLGHPILGDEVLLDHVHPDIATHSLIAERLLEVLVERGVARRDASWTEGRRRQIYDRVVASIDRETNARRDLNLAKVLGWAGKLEEAEGPLERAREVLPDEPEVRLSLGVLYQRTGRWQEAAGELHRAVELTPASPEAHFNLGVVYGHLGRTEEGVAALEEAVRLRPGYAEALHNLGVLQRRLGRLTEAVAALERARQLLPEAAEIHASLGVAYRRQGRLEAAAAALGRSLELAPDDAEARTDLGVTHALAGRPAEAVRELEAVLSNHPEHGEAHYNLGLLHARQGRPEEALAAYRRALAAVPGHARANNNLGILLASRGQLAEAGELLARALASDPLYAEAPFNLSIVHDGSGRSAEALRSVERAVELAPENARFHQALAMLLAVRGQHERALVHFRRAHEGGLEVPSEVLHRLGG